MSAIQIGLILLVACIVAMFSRRLHLPYSVGLVAAGIVLALVGSQLNLTLTPELIYSVLLPPLIFEAALQLKWRPFRDNLPVSLALAFPGVLVSAAVVAVGMHLLVGWSWLAAALFGVLIAATDPVSVIAAFKEMKVESRLSMLVESESLLNDGAAAVAFAILALFANGSEIGVGTVLATLVWMVVGGLATGAAVSGALLLLAGRTDDHLVEITLTTIAAYGSLLLVGNIGWNGAISEVGREHVISFWEYAAFLSNSVIFILIGGHEAHEATKLLTFAAAAAVMLMLLGRAAAVYPLCAIFRQTSHVVDARHQHVLFWGGLRGALALALALATPDTVAEKGELIVAAFAVVAFSIFAQGLTMPGLISALRLKPPPEADAG